MESQEKTTTKKPLFAVAFRARKKRSWNIHIEYLHAVDVEEARVLFTAGNSMMLVKRRMKIIGIAPAIGFFVEDKQGLVLNAS